MNPKAEREGIKPHGTIVSLSRQGREVQETTVKVSAMHRLHSLPRLISRSIDRGSNLDQHKHSTEEVRWCTAPMVLKMLEA
jgi:hypothetical protein